jgi:hypothetical protein
MTTCDTFASVLVFAQEKIIKAEVPNNLRVRTVFKYHKVLKEPHRSIIGLICG